MVRTDELDNRNLIMFKQLKNRFSDITQNKRFLLEVDRSKMRLKDSGAKADDFDVGGKVGGLGGQSAGFTFKRALERGGSAKLSSGKSFKL